MKTRVLQAIAMIVAGCFGLYFVEPTIARFGQQTESEGAVEAVRRNTLGVAYMNQQRSSEALGLFELAFESDPTLAVARLNQVIALFNMQRFDEALEILDAFTIEHPESARAWYNLGLTYRNLGQAEPAVEAFSRVIELDAEDADSHYLLGLMHAQLRRHTEAIAAYERALALDPYHASAEFGTARAYQAQGQIDQAREHLARFQQITRDNLGVPMGLAYGDQGPYSLAEDVSGVTARAPDPIEVRFVAAAAEADLDFVHDSGTVDQMAGTSAARFLGAGACFLDYDRDGFADVFLPNGGAGTSSLYRNRGDGGFEDATETAGLAFRGYALGCAVGDYDNDGRVDLAVSLFGGVQLLRNAEAGAFADVTSDSGIEVDGLPLGLTFIDFDHDGDLDLYVSRFIDFEWSGEPPGFEAPVDVAAAGNMLWRNNGNGAFIDWTDETALAGSGPGIGAVGTDINNDRAVDFVLTGWSASPQIRLNPREGAFSSVRWEGSMPAPPAGVVVADFDKDTWMDLAFTHWGAPGLTLWRNVEGRGFESVSLPDLGWVRGWGIAALDYDNDGWIDLAAAGERGEEDELRLLRNRGLDGFEDVSDFVGFDGVSVRRPRALVSADYDGDGDIDLLATQNGGPILLLRNDGGNQNAWLRIALEGLNDNKSAIGTKVEVFAGTHRQKMEVHGASGYLGQSALTLVAGIAANTEADTVRMLWPTGVLQDEVQLQARETHALVEIDRRGSSCPVLFVWNGEKYEFVTDVIGAGIVGHWVAPGQRNISDPTEYVKIDGSSVAVKDGRLSFRLVEPMEELVYLDQVRLLAVDHPADVDVYPHEYFSAIPPFPEFEVIATRGARLPVGAWDDAGRDVLAELTDRDRRYVTGFRDTAFRGFAERHSLELEWREIDTSGPVRLIMHGFVDYFSATSVFAAHQAGIKAILPYVEAMDASGRWTRVIDDLGFPAGLARTMTRDISGRLPDGTNRIRIITNLKIYWDQILIDTSPEGIPLRLTEVPMSSATLGWLGYPRAAEGQPKADVVYVHEEVSATGPYARHAGAYTRFGDVRLLAAAVDDRFVVFGSGEEVAIEFDPSRLPQLPAGWKRDYFFYADGFAKDMDFYEAYSSTVEPLPFHTEQPYPYRPGGGYPMGTEHLEYQLRENIRHRSGRPAPGHRFEYRRAGP